MLYEYPISSKLITFMNLISKILSFISFFICLLTIVILPSCNDDGFSSNPAHKLSFAADTLSFDTVFTAMGSATKVFKIYNPNKENLKISQIELERGASSPFHINVDGYKNPNNQFSDIEIRAKDSLFVFITVNITPNNASSALIETDRIKFITNSNEQKIVLEAYGQDVEIMRNHVVYSDSTLTSDRPYLIYGYLAVDSAKTLTIPAGCKLYFYNSAHMMVYGNLQALGTQEQPIIIRGHRLDNVGESTNPLPYNYVAGQWSGIYLFGQQGKHILSHVTINSAVVGVYLRNEDIQSNKRPHLEIVNSRIHNFTYYGLRVENADLTVVNSEISNSGYNCVYLNGGKHTFIHCTIANYFSGSFQPATRESKQPSLMVVDVNRIAPMETYIYNSVIAGSFEKEFSLITQYPEQYNGTFSHSYIRRDSIYTTPQFTDIRWSEKKDTVFSHPYYDNEEMKYYDFTPDSVSPLRELGDPDIITQFDQYKDDLKSDLNGNPRPTGSKPDAGAYQWMPAKRE